MCTPNRLETFYSRNFCSSFRFLKLRLKVGKVLGYTQLHCAVAFLVDFRTHTILPSLRLRRRQELSVPCSGKPTIVTFEDPRPRFGKHILGLRLSATPSDHAFRPRLSHAFQPRLSATPSGHVFRRAIRIEDIEFCHSNV